MKTKFVFFTLAFLVATSAGYASFPVQKKEAFSSATPVVAVEENANSINPTVSINADQTVVQADEAYTSPAAASGGKSQLIALLLAILVGVLGIHRFYLGYTLEGVIQLLTAGGCGIWALIDIIRIATGDLKPKNGEYAEKL